MKKQSAPFLKRKKRPVGHIVFVKKRNSPV